MTHPLDQPIRQLQRARDLVPRAHSDAYWSAPSTWPQSSGGHTTATPGRVERPEPSPLDRTVAARYRTACRIVDSLVRDLASWTPIGLWPPLLPHHRPGHRATTPRPEPVVRRVRLAEMTLAIVRHRTPPDDLDPEDVAALADQTNRLVEHLQLTVGHPRDCDNIRGRSRCRGRATRRNVRIHGEPRRANLCESCFNHEKYRRRRGAHT